MASPAASGQRYGHSIIAMLPALFLALMLPVSGAQTSLSDASSANDTVTAVGGDSCSQLEHVDGCWYSVSCKTCLVRDGCALETSSGRCLTIAAIQDVAVTGDFLLSGQATYCNPDDVVCVDKCELISLKPERCSSSSFTMLSLTNLVIGLVALVPLGVYMALKSGSPEASRAFRLAYVDRNQPQRRRKPRGGEPLPAGLMLEAWWCHVDEHAQEFGGLELRSCFVTMGSDAQSEEQHRSSSCEAGMSSSIQRRDGDVARPGEVLVEATEIEDRRSSAERQT